MITARKKAKNGEQAQCWHTEWLTQDAAWSRKEDAELTVGCFPDAELISIEHEH